MCGRQASCLTDTISGLCPHRAEGARCSLGPLFGGTDPTHEGPLLVTQSPPKGPTSYYQRLEARISSNEILISCGLAGPRRDAHIQPLPLHAPGSRLTREGTPARPPPPRAPPLQPQEVPRGRGLNRTGGEVGPWTAEDRLSPPSPSPGHGHLPASRTAAAPGG